MTTLPADALCWCVHVVAEHDSWGECTRCRCDGWEPYGSIAGQDRERPEPKPGRTVVSARRYLEED